jgi:D-alanyl-D-alanine dipeptidase
MGLFLTCDTILQELIYERKMENKMEKTLLNRVKSRVLFLRAFFLNKLRISFTKASLPKGFVYLEDVDPSILQNLKYATCENFIGTPIEGYKRNKVILTRKAAYALKKAQTIFRKKGFSLVIYDAYRPQKAVNHFKRWGLDANHLTMKEWFYPHLDKEDVFRLGFIAQNHSTHSRGSTVDLTLIADSHKLHPIKPQKRLLGHEETLFLDDGTLDMGSSFDYFGEASYSVSSVISQKAKNNRAFLNEVMSQVGFENYPKEWWHFTLKKEPFPTTYFDFDVE